MNTVFYDGNEDVKSDRDPFLRLDGVLAGSKNRFDALSRVVLDDEPPQCRRIVLARIEKRQHACLVAHHIARRSIDRMRIASLEFGIAFGSRDKESVHHMQLVESGKIEIAAIHEVIGTGFDHKIVED